MGCQNKPKASSREGLFWQPATGQPISLYSHPTFVNDPAKGIEIIGETGVWAQLPSPAQSFTGGVLRASLSSLSVFTPFQDAALMGEVIVNVGNVTFETGSTVPSVSECAWEAGVHPNRKQVQIPVEFQDQWPA